MRANIFKQRLQILEPERFVLLMTGAIIFLCLGQIFWRGVAFDWAGYGSVIAISLACMAGGQFYRISGRSARIGTALMSTGLFAVFSAFVVVFNYLMMPIQRPPIDGLLVWADGLVGYHWPDVVAWAAAHPTLTSVIKVAYLSTIPQLALLVVILGLSGRVRQLHVFLVSVTITSIIAVVFWGYFPSHGAKSLVTLPADLEFMAGIVVDTAYGKDLVRMAAEGPGLISPDEIKGLIAFPSYHAVLAFTAVYAMRGVKWIFPIYLVLNILILPGAPIHGGHHLIDVPAGFALFLLGTYLAERTVGAMYRKSGMPAVLPSDREVERPMAGSAV